MNTAAAIKVELVKVASDAWRGEIAGQVVVVTKSSRYLGRKAGRSVSETTFSSTFAGKAIEAGSLSDIKAKLAKVAL
jgi:hypothetical protein